MVPFFAIDVTQSVDNLTNVGINILAIIGGFIAGYIITWILVALLSKYALKRKIPRPVQLLLRYVGGLLLAILIALYVFGEGGGGMGSPGDDGINSGDQQGEEIPDVPDPRPEPEQQPDPQPENTEPVPKGQRMEIIVLGGYISDMKYYRLVETGEEFTLQELTERIQQKLLEPNSVLKELRIRKEGGDAGEVSPAVNALETWAKRQLDAEGNRVLEVR